MCYAGPDGPPAPTIKTKEEFLFHLSRLSTSGKLEEVAEQSICVALNLNPVDFIGKGE